MNPLLSSLENGGNGKCGSCNKAFEILEGSEWMKMKITPEKEDLFGKGKSTPMCEVCMPGDYHLHKDDDEEEETPKEADEFCVFCHQFFCGRCMKHHKKSRLSALHQVMSAKEAVATGLYRKQIAEMCNCTSDCCDYKNSYCFDHNISICSTSRIVDHRRCNVYSQNNAEKTFKDTAAVLIEEKYAKAGMDSVFAKKSIETLNSIKEKLIQEEEQEEKQFAAKTTKVTTRRALKSKKPEILRDTTESTKRKRKQETAETLAKKIELFVKESGDSRSIIKEFVAAGGIWDVLVAYPHITKRFDEIGGAKIALEIEMDSIMAEDK